MIALGLSFAVGPSQSFAKGGKQQPELPSDYLPVPVLGQTTPYSCGPAALMALLYYWQAYAGFERDLYEICKTTEKDGTEPKGLVDGATHFGLKAQALSNMSLGDLRKFLAEGATIILNIQAWRDETKTKLPWSETWDAGHYIDLIAMDEDFAYFMDPSLETGYGYIELTELMDRWNDYEDRSGQVTFNYRLGIVIQGEDPLTQFPGPLSPIE